MIHAGNKKPRERQLDGEGSDDRPRKDVMKSYSLLLRSIEKSPMPHQRSRSDLPNPATPASLSWRWEPLQRKGVLKEICEKTEARAGGILILESIPTPLPDNQSYFGLFIHLDEHKDRRFPIK